MFYKFPSDTLIIYLDQNKWIDLARANVSHREGNKYRCALERVVESAKRGKAIFPLSIQHFIETRKQRNLKKRKELAETMAEISQGIVIAPKSHIMEWEIQRAIAIAFNKTIRPRPPIFGYGLSLLFGRDFMEQEIRKQDQEIHDYLKGRAKEVLSSKEVTKSFLVGDDEELNASLIRGLTEIDEAFIRRTEESREEEKEITEHMQKIIYMATLTKELEKPIINALNSYGKTKDEFLSLGRRRAMEFYRNIPTLDVEIELATSLNKLQDRKLRLNDTHDIGFLSKAIPYCDVVVTENLFHSIVLQRRLDEKYNTKVTTDLNDLIPLLDTQ